MALVQSRWRLVGTLEATAANPFTMLTTAALATEVLEGTLLTLEQVTTSLTVLALSACRDPKQSPRLRALLDDLVGLIQECEDELALNDR